MSGMRRTRALMAAGEPGLVRMRLTFEGESLNTLNVFFLFPGRVCFGFFGLLGSKKTKNLSDKSPLSVLEPSASRLNFSF